MQGIFHLNDNVPQLCPASLEFNSQVFLFLQTCEIPLLSLLWMLDYLEARLSLEFDDAEAAFAEEEMGLEDAAILQTIADAVVSLCLELYMFVKQVI